MFQGLCPQGVTNIFIWYPVLVDQIRKMSDFEVNLFLNSQAKLNMHRVQRFKIRARVSVRTLHVRLHSSVEGLN